VKKALPIFLALILGACSKQELKTSAAPAARTTEAEPGKVTIAADSPKLKQIRVETVESAVVPVDEVDAPGRIEVNPNRVSHIVAPVAGRVIAVNVRLGDAVSQGQPVLTMESPDADAAISAYLQAESQLGQMRSAAIKAQADLDRVRDLLEHQAVAKKEVMNAELALSQAKASVEQSEAMKQQALRRLEIFGLKPGQFGQRIVLPAPVSGKVLELTVVPGEFRNDTNQALATIADLSTVWVASDVPESAIRFIKVGEPISLELSAFPGEVFRGRVARIADTVDPATRTIKVRAELDNASGRLRPEMFGRIRHTEPGLPTPVVPSSALVQSETRTYVYREVSPGVFQQTPVTAGSRAGEKIAILAGIKAGDRVVVDGVMLLKAN
jgi:membrane fusion protein, heavy metal efflux system